MKGLGVCEDCGTPYPVEVSEDDSMRVMGNEGACERGNREFALVTDDDVVDSDA